MNYNYEQYKINIEILNGVEKTIKGISGEHPVNFEIKGSDGKLTKVSKEEFARWMVNEKNDKNQVEKPKESLVYGVKWDIDGSTYFTERKSKDGIFKETYYQPRSEEEKNQIIKRNKERREKESLSTEKPENQGTTETNDKQEIKPTTSQQISPSNSNNQNNNHFGTIILTTGILVIAGLTVYGIGSAMKKKNKKSR